MQNIKIIAIGDIHFGRIPSVFELTEKYPLQEQALDLIAEYVIENEIDIVLFAGDVLDSDSAYFEASASLEKFLNTIKKNNVTAYAVSGNHDYNILKKLCLKEDNFKVLGANGEWESVICNLKNDKKIIIKGKSFINSHQHESHFTNYKKSSNKNEPQENVPSIGLIHCDIGNADKNGEYAPSSYNDFANTTEDVWACGHIHAPKYVNTNSKVITLGSLQPLDPSETGIHGAWLIEFENKNVKDVKLIPFAKAYYDELSVDIKQLSDFESEITKILKEVNLAYKKQISFPYSLSLRLTINVPYQQLSEFKQYIFQMPDTNPIVFGNITVEKINLKSNYLSDLETLSKRKDPLGILANYLNVIEKRVPEEKYHEYIKNSSKSMLSNLNKNSLSLLESANNDEEKIRESLLKGGEILICKFIQELGLSND